MHYLNNNLCINSVNKYSELSEVEKNKKFNTLLCKIFKDKLLCDQISDRYFSSDWDDNSSELQNHEIDLNDAHKKIINLQKGILENEKNLFELKKYLAKGCNKLIDLQGIRLLQFEFI